MSALVLYNTATRKKESFVPMDSANVRMYVCGPTVYDYAHIGNARPVVVFDVLFRVLQKIYGAAHVTYARNITDIDDKIINAAAANNEKIGDLTARTEQQFNADMTALNTIMPTMTPRATEHVAEMQAIIATLIEKNNAYEAEGHVLFHVPSMPHYGALSGRNRDEQIAGARVDVAPYKRDAADFVLWKPSTADQPGWDSPWGRGRPGWHIECSAMAKKHLGPVFDIHGGGIDLVFPHHENEIAQSCCAHDTAQLAQVWMHNGFLTVNGEKMSKSLGNFFTVHDLLHDWPGEVIRYALLTAHYRQPLDFTDDLLKQAKQSLDRLYGALRDVSHGNENVSIDLSELSLDDDLNTPMALTAIHEMAGQVYKQKMPVDAARLFAAGGVLGLLQQNPQEWFRWQAPSHTGMDDASIDALVAGRTAARANKNFARSDEIRNQLAAMNIVLDDTAGGTVWRRG